MNQAQGFSKYTESEATAKLHKYQRRFGFGLGDSNVDDIRDMLDIYDRLKRGVFLPDRIQDESDEDYISRVFKAKGKMDAIIVVGRLKNLGLKDAKEYVDTKVK